MSSRLARAPEVMQPQLPADIEIHTVLDNSEHIYAMIHSLSEAAVVAAVLVVVSASSSCAVSEAA